MRETDEGRRGGRPDGERRRDAGCPSVSARLFGAACAFLVLLRRVLCSPVLSVAVVAIAVQGRLSLPMPVLGEALQHSRADCWRLLVWPGECA